MSFFSELIIPFITEEISHAYEHQVFRNTAKKFFYFSDTEKDPLSLAAKYSTLIKEIQQLDKHTDTQILVKISDYLLLFCADIEPFSTEANHEYWQTLALQIKRALTYFYNKLETLALLDMQPDNSPANILQQHLIAYLYVKITEKYES